MVQLGWLKGKQKLFFIFSSTLVIFVFTVFFSRILPDSRSSFAKEEGFEEMEGLWPKRERNPGKSALFRRALNDFYQKETALTKEFFSSHYDTIGPEVMIGVLNEEPFCHSQAHNLGRVIYERTRDLAQATAICQSQCSGGCVHGVLMQMFAPNEDTERHITPEEIDAALKDTITTACEKSEITRYTGVGNCYHAVAHALVPLANYDVARALDLCKLFESKGEGALYYCATGVYMERDIEFGEIDAQKVDNLFPCTTHAYPAACYRYKLRRLYSLPSDYQTVRDRCLTLTDNQRAGCFHGLGFGSYEMVYRRAAALNQLCSAGTEEDQRMCLEGVFGVINKEDKKFSAKACEAYTAGNQMMCQEASGTTNYGMDRDFSRYSK